LLFTILLAVILSIDCFGVGLAYGMRHVVLPWYGRVIISCCSGIAIAVSMCLGRLLEGIIPGEQIHLFGESMLVCLGVFFLVRSIMELRKERVEELCTDETDSACVSETPLFQWRVPGLDVMIKIMNNPACRFRSFRANQQQRGCMAGVCSGYGFFRRRGMYCPYGFFCAVGKHLHIIVCIFVRVGRLYLGRSCRRSAAVP